eukprot:GFKZ01012133.1.p1 GENE.GFKZ01012133.1~~GFKZ01012133.1.p1  ORF type:complete len:350 (-),score=38.66 GFKZ01012133.1:1261-2310(-)
MLIRTYCPPRLYFNKPSDPILCRPKLHRNFATLTLPIEPNLPLRFLQHPSITMQKSITSFFKPSATSMKGKKRSTALSPNAAEQLKEQVLAPDVKARIEANRAAARAKLLARTAQNTNDPNKPNFGAALEPSWRHALTSTTSEPFWKSLADFVAEQRKKETVFPPPDKIFSAFNHCAFSRTKVVIIGQDPYHGPRQAHGMCFSVPDGVTPPPSLVNIFGELEKDILGFKRPRSGCLEKWANQGVLLLNSVLTVEMGQPGSHRGRGWERFTDAVVDSLNKRSGPGIVFMLWGGYAKKKGAKVNPKKHCILTAVHPSPLSANRGGWFGNKHFSKANAFLKRTDQHPIDWTL